MMTKLLSIIKNKKLISTIVGLSVVGGGGVAVQQNILGGSFPDANWVVIKNFDGYQTKLDPSKISDGANPQGQNTTVNDGDRVSIRPFGYEIYPSTDTASSSEEPITSLHNFRKRDGTNILMRSHGSVMEFYNPASAQWETLKTGLTSGQKFGYADFNINTDLVSYVYFGNAVDPFSRWTGNVSNLSTALAVNDSYVYVDDITGFMLGSDTIIVCGTELAYTSASTTLNRFSLTASSTVACDDGRAVAEAVETTAGNPRGNIYLNEDNRLFIAGVASSTQAVFFSAYGDANTFANTLISEAVDTSAGIFNLGEGGGGVTSLATDEGSIYMFKRSTVRKATINDTTYTLSNLKPYDGKSQTVGSIGINSVFTGDNSVFFATPDNQLMGLARVEGVDYPQINALSDVIQPTVDQFNFDTMTGITFRNKAYFAAKSNTTATKNDVLLIYNLETKKWDSPILGLNISAFTVYDDGTSEELYFGDAVSPNVYKLTDEVIDNSFDVLANWRSKQYDFGQPQAQKQMVDLFVDGYISENTTLTVNLLVDEDGYTQSFSTDIVGSNKTYIYDSNVYNAFGLSAFGTNRFGAQDDLSGKKKFRIYLGKDFIPKPFYTAQLEFVSDGANQQWEVTNYGFRVRPYSVPEKNTLYQAFK